MLDPMPLVKLTAGEVLSRSFSFYGKHFGTLAGIAIVTSVPVTVLQMVLSRRFGTSGALDMLDVIGDRSDSEALMIGCLYPLLVALLTLACNSWMAGAATFAVDQSFQGGEVSAGRSLGAALGRFGSLLSVNLSIAVRVLVGCLFLIIPGIVWFCAYALAIPALMIEGSRPTEALKRSATLAKGQRWTILAVTFTLIVINAVLGILVGFAAVSLLAVAPSLGNTAFQFTASLLPTVAVPLLFVAVTLLYHDTRIRSEDPNADPLSRALEHDLGRPGEATAPAPPSALREQPEAPDAQPAEARSPEAPPATAREQEATAPQQDVDCGNYAARMSWRSITYVLGARAIHLQIEPMTTDPDIVCIPDEDTWRQTAPEWAKARRKEIVDCLLAVQWNRSLEWREGSDYRTWHTAASRTRVLEGTLEATRSGQALARQALFHPGQSLTQADVREIWQEAARKHARGTRGRVTIDLNQVVANSVLEDIELPQLRRNRRVDLELKSLAPSPGTSNTAAAGAETRATEPPAPATAVAASKESASSHPPANRQNKLKVSDLFIKLAPETQELLLDDWRWMVGNEVRVFQVTVFGDLFVKTPNGQIHWLDTGRGTYQKVAENVSDWKKLLAAKASEWLHVKLLRELHAMNLHLASGQVYGWLEPLMLGGEETVDNVYAIPILSHVRQMAEVAKQQR